jgi:excisionase family DNA binding protein
MAEQETFTLDEAADWLKISRSMVTRHITAGRLIAHRPNGPKGRTKVIHIDDLRDFLKSSPTEPT